MATLKHLSSCNPAIHSTACKDIGKKHTGNVVRVPCVLSSPTPDHKSTDTHNVIQPVKESPFKRNLLSGMKEPSLIQKAENRIMDYCSTLEGDEGYQCWEAYFEFQNMKREYMAEAKARAEAGSKPSNPLERLEDLVRQSGGVKTLIEMVHFETKISKMRKEAKVKDESTLSASNNLEEKRRPFPEPDGLPKTREEMEEDEKALMPESSYTRLFRRIARGRFPAWYTPRPDHETD